MAKKKTTAFVCASCGETYIRWQGRCDTCGTWNQIEEIQISSLSSKHSLTSTENKNQPLVSLQNISSSMDAERIKSGIKDFDQILGGGVVPGSFILIGGEPGVGKSTLLLEISRKFPGKVYYFSGEESPAQIRLRANRMKIHGEELYLSRETDLDEICARMIREKPDLVIIDSIQTVSRSGSVSLPGSVALLRDSAMSVLEVCKATSIPVIVTGHITREGTIAGPKLLEHMVDTLLYFESDRMNHLRILRGIKNRFGPVGEVALFEMVDKGLVPLASLTLKNQNDSHVGSGRVFSVAMEGSRPIALEVQALVSRVKFGPARRVAEGFDTNRLVLISAVIEKYLKLRLSECDIFINIAGGLSVEDRALDLAISLAILSSYSDTPFDSGIAALGEVGLSGEVRPISLMEPRLRELQHLGFHRALAPMRSEKYNGEIKEIGIQTVEELSRFINAPT